MLANEIAGLPIFAGKLFCRQMPIHEKLRPFWKPGDPDGDDDLTVFFNHVDDLEMLKTEFFKVLPPPPPPPAPPPPQPQPQIQPLLPPPPLPPPTTHPPPTPL